MVFVLVSVNNARITRRKFLTDNASDLFDCSFLNYSHVTLFTRCVSFVPLFCRSFEPFFSLFLSFPSSLGFCLAYSPVTKVRENSRWCYLLDRSFFIISLSKSASLNDCSCRATRSDARSKDLITLVKIRGFLRIC